MKSSRRQVAPMVVAALAAAAAVSGAVPARAHSPVPVIPYGVVDLGDTIEVGLPAATCATSTIRVQAETADGTVSGPDTSGCGGLGIVPDLAVVEASGWEEGEPLELAVVAAGRRVPLRYMRLHAEHATPAAGTPKVVDDAGDPRGGGAAVALGAGDVIGLGHSDLRNIRSIAVRSSASADGACDGAGLSSCAPTLFELRAGAPDGPVVASGDLGPAGIAQAYNAGWPDSWIMSTWKVMGSPPPGVTELYFAVVASPADARINWVDLNGSGIRLPRRFEDLDGAESVFDGSSFGGWTNRGFTLRDGAMRAESHFDPGDLSWADPIVGAPGDFIAVANGGGSAITSHRTFRDAVLRLEYRFEQFEDNGSVILGPFEAQMHDASEWFTGGIARGATCFPGYPPGGLLTSTFHQLDPNQPAPDCGYPAERIKSGTFPDWATLEVVQNGDTWVVRIEGREVSRATLPVDEPWAITLNNSPIFSRQVRIDSSLAATGHDAATPGEWGHIWFRNIRVYPCAGPQDPVCAT